MFEDTSKSRLDIIEHPLLKERNISLWLKREDLLHDLISGNKWRKLKYNFLEARHGGFHKILTFGGAYSNHLLATAASANEYGFDSIGVVRGDELDVDSNPTLEKCHELGMHLVFVSRSDYRLKEDQGYLSGLTKDIGKCYIIPEGGTNLNAVRGCKEVILEIERDFDFVASAVGTGGTIAGLAAGLKTGQAALGFSVLKNAHYLDDMVRGWLKEVNSEPIGSCKINHTYHLGGYAKFTVALIEFINEFKKSYNIQLDPIYTGKLMFGLFDLIEHSYFPEGSKIVAIHTGGLQGIAGFNARHGDLIDLTT